MTKPRLNQHTQHESELARNNAADKTPLFFFNTIRNLNVDMFYNRMICKVNAAKVGPRSIDKHPYGNIEALIAQPYTIARCEIATGA